MKKGRVKKITALLMSLTLVLASAVSVGAADNKAFLEKATKIGLGIDENETGKIQPKYVPTCSSPSGKHLMKGRGPGWAYYGAAPSNDLRLKGQAAQCSYCHVVVITENNLFLNPSLPWGKYAMWNPGYQVGNGVVMYTTSFGNITSKNDPFALGFVFN